MARRLIDWSRIRTDIGGKWLGYRNAWIVIAPLWVALSLLLSPGLTHPPDALWLLVANSVGVAAALVLLLACNVTIFRNSSNTPVSIAVVVLVGAALGGIKALVTNVCLGWFGVGPVIDAVGLLERMVLLAIMGAWLLPTTSIVLAVRERIENERDELIRERIRSRFAHAATSPFSAGVDPVDTLVNDFISEVKHGVQSARSAGFLAEELNNLVDRRLRPLSQLMWQQEQRRVPRLRFASLVRIMYSDHQFAPVPTLLGYVVLFLGPQIAYAGFATGLARTAIQLAIIAVVFALGKRLPRTTAAVGAIVYFGINLLLPLLLNMLSTALFGAIPGYSPLASYLLLALYFVLASLLFGIFRAAATERASIASEIERLAEQQAAVQYEINEAQFRRNDLAHYLHSHVQNGMLSLALRLNESAGRPVSPADRLLVETLLADLAQFSSPRSTEDLAAGLAEIAQRWRGFVALQIMNEVETTPTPRVVRSALQVVNECITNAVRHGDASTIELNISEQDGNVTIACTDNGRGIRDNARPGLGSALFDSVAGAHWSLTRAGELTQLDVRIPLPL